MENLNSFLKYYIGQPCREFIGSKVLSRTVPFSPTRLQYVQTGTSNFKLILKRLSDIDEDGREAIGLEQFDGGEFSLSPELTHTLMGLGYWLFDETAFEKGLIIDEKTLK